MKIGARDDVVMTFNRTKGSFNSCWGPSQAGGPGQSAPPVPLTTGLIVHTLILY